MPPSDDEMAGRSIEADEACRKARALLELLAHAEAQVRAGRVISQDDVFREVAANIERGTEGD